MTDASIQELRSLREVVLSLVAQMSPWISTHEMCKRYDCIPKTLNNMERDGRIPFRKSGKWDRVALIQWESNLP